MGSKKFVKIIRNFSSSKNGIKHTQTETLKVLSNNIFKNSTQPLGVLYGTVFRNQLTNHQ